MAMRKPGIYVPLSAYYFDDPALMEAGEDAEILFLRMLAYAARQIEQEGFVSDQVISSRLGILPRVSGTGTGNGTGTDAGNGTGNVPGTDAVSRAGRLAEVDLLTRVTGGYIITSWLRWNRTAEEAGKERSRDRERKGSDKDIPSSRAGNGTGTDAGNGTGNGKFSRTVSLPPDTDTDTDTETLSSSTDADASTDRDFASFWMVYDKKRGKKAAAQKWRIALRKRGVTADSLIAAASAYVSTQKSEGKHPTYTKDPAVWLNGEHWNDEPETVNGRKFDPQTAWMFGQA